jgi:hypothetical protein
MVYYAVAVFVFGNSPRGEAACLRNPCCLQHPSIGRMKRSKREKVAKSSHGYQHKVFRFNKAGGVRINLTLRRVRVTIVAVESKISMYYACVSVALLIQHALHMRHISLSSVACLAVPYFSTVSHEGVIFGERLWNIKCVV